MSARLAVRDLTVAGPSGAHPVLRGVSFEVGEGEVIGLIGESGCGKSMTLLSVLALLPPGLALQRGSILLDGRDLVGLPSRELRALRGRDVAIIFQDPLNSLNPSVRVGEQIGEGLRIHGIERGSGLRASVLRLMREVGIPDPEATVDHFPHEFSGGMQQRVLIAAALACGPRLLLADEPTTALDVSIQWQIIELLRTINRRRSCSIVLVTHDLALASRFCDRIVVMYAGQVVEVGPTSEVIHRPSHPYTRALLACLPSLGGGRVRLRPIPGEVPVVEEVPATGCAFAPRCGLCRPDCLEGDINLREVKPGHSARCILVPGAGLG